jgi:CBS domain-containing protein
MIKAKDVMTKEVITISPDATLIDAIELLIAKGISGMPVLDADEKVIGIISEKDILNFAFSGNLRMTKVKEAMTKNVVSFSSDTDIDKISLCISENKFRRVPIIDEGKLVGILSRRDIIRMLL